MDLHSTDADADAAGRAILVATLAVVAATFCWGLNAVIAKGAFEAGIPPARLAEARTVVAGVPLIAYLALRHRDLLVPARATVGPILLFGIGLVGTLLPFLLVVNALRRLPAAVAGIAATTEPVFASGLAWLLLNQSLGAAQLAGGGLVVSGVILAQFARRD